MKVRLIIVFLSLFFSISLMAAELDHKYPFLNSKSAKIGRELRRIPGNPSNSSGWTWIDWEMIIEYAGFFSEYEEAYIAQTYGYPYPFNSWNKLDKLSKIRIIEFDTIQSVSGDTVVGKFSKEIITTLNNTGNPEESITSVWDT